MARAALLVGLALIAAGVAVTLQGLFGWGLLGLAAGFALVFGPFANRPLIRFGGAAAAAIMSVALLMPLAPRPRADPRVGSGGPATPPPGPRVVASPEAGSPSAPPAGGPSEEARRAIFRELVLAEERARREADATHPDRDSGSAVPDQERAVRRAEKRARLARLLEERYRKEVAARYAIPEEGLPAILEEGRRLGWAEKAP